MNARVEVKITERVGGVERIVEVSAEVEQPYSSNALVEVERVALRICGKPPTK